MTPTVLLTRPAPDSAAFAAALTERIAVPVVVSPLMRIVTDGTLPNMDDVDGVIFTSRNGVRAYRELNGPARPCYCVGPGTAEEARAAGMPARFAEGDAVASLRFGNGYREMATGPAEGFVKIPQADGAHLALASSGVAAWLGLTHTGAMKAGETVAISAAAGGLGHLDVQIAKALGCHVVAICGGMEKASFVRRLGADRVIDYRSESVAQVLAREYPDRLDVALDTVGGEIFDAFLAQLAPHGRLVISGWASDMEDQPQQVTRPRIGHAIYYKGASVRAFMNGLLTGHWPAAREAVFGLYQAKKLRPQLDAHGLEGIEAVSALVERLSSGRSMGKVAVKL